MKKTNKHPLTFFREEGEKRKAMFQKGGYKTPVQNLKKAQDGIEMENDMMINKPGYGAKKTVNPTEIQAVPGPKGFGSEEFGSAIGWPSRRPMETIVKKRPFQRGGSVKRKK